MRSFNYEPINKIDRRSNGEIWFQRGIDFYKVKNQIVCSVYDEFQIKFPSFLQKYRFCVINDHGSIILLNHEQTNEQYWDYIYINNVGNMAFCKDIKLVCWF